MSDQIGVLGAGAWGTTLAVLLADAERPVSLWAHSSEAAERMAHERTNERYLPGVVFPPNLRVADAADLAEPHRFFVVAVPSAHMRETLRSIGRDDRTLIADAIEDGGDTVNVTMKDAGGDRFDSFRWLIGEDSPAFGGAIRDMWTPTCYGDPGKVSDAEYLWHTIEVPERSSRTRQNIVFPENEASLRLHEAAGFRIVGVRERIG